MTPMLRALYSSSLLQAKLSLARSMVQFVVFVQPVLYATVSFYMFDYWGYEGAAEYVVFGSGLLTLWMTTLWSSATDLNRERTMGTLELLVIAPVPLPVILLGKILANTAIGLFTILISYAWSTGVLGLTIVVADPVRLIYVLALVLWAFAGFAVFLANLFLLSRQANVIANGLSFPIYLASGLYFPLTMLPPWFRYLGLGLPLSWAREAIRWVVIGPGAPGLITRSPEVAMTGLAIVGAMYYLLAFGLMHAVLERRMRHSGQLAMA